MHSRSLNVCGAEDLVNRLIPLGQIQICLFLMQLCLCPKKVDKFISVYSNGNRFDFRAVWCYSLIYIYFLLIISMSLNIMCDNCEIPS